MDQECGHGVWMEGDLLPAAVEAVLGEMGRTNRRPQPRMPVRTTNSLQPLSQLGLVVKRKPEGEDGRIYNERSKYTDKMKHYSDIIHPVEAIL